MGRPNAAAFFRRPAVSHLRLSPNGRAIAGILSRDGQETIVVFPASGGEPRPVGKLDRGEELKSWTVGELGWGSNDRLLVSVHMPSPGAREINVRQSRLLLIDVATAEARYLGKRWPRQEYMQFQDQIISFLPEDPDGLLLGLWVPGQKGVGARRVDLGSGRLKTVASPRRGTLSWAVDHRDQVRVGLGEARWDSQNFIVARVGGSGGFKEILNWNPYEDEGGFTFAGFDPDPKKIYIKANTEDGRNGIYRFDLETGTRGEVLFAHPEVDAGRLHTSKVDGRLLSVSYVTDRRHLHFFDAGWKRLHERIAKALPDRENVLVSSDKEERLFIVSSSADNSPPSYYLLDTSRNSMTALFDAYPELAKVPLAPMEPITYLARDGLEVPGYLTQPIDGSKPPFPLIVHPHGGPWARDVWGWDPTVQFLVSRGFAVLQPNFRGSTGYGRAFTRRGRGRWGLEMQDDITDAALWAVEQGIADRDRVGIFGGSYGGYAALRALQVAPDLFRAGASFAGVTDLPSFLDDDSKYYGMIDDMEQLVGDRRSDRKRLEETSPARGASQIRGSVLIAHGTEDPRVQVDQAKRMARALEAVTVDVETYLYEGEVHGFLDERNEIDFYTRLAAFFERTLKPGRGASARP
ncbi:MAG: S9 family peptidase [Myxococcota bacterium]